MSWAVEAMTESGNWVGNALRFVSNQDAVLYVSRFLMGRSTRIVESVDPANYGWENGRLIVKRGENVG